MTRLTIAPYVTGALGGLVIAMALLAFFGSFVALDTVQLEDGVASFSAGAAGIQNLYGGATIGSEDVNFPVPQRQIDVSNGILVQNR